MSLPDFTALDFETAQGYRWSICQVGLVRVERGEVVGEMSMLIRPPGNDYWQQFTEIHGLCSQDTENALNFANAWGQIAPWIESKTVVAHNGAFDFGCLRKTLEYYGMPEPEYRPACTYQIYRKGLAALCSDFSIPLNHHNALSDARACASLYLRHLQSTAT